MRNWVGAERGEGARSWRLTSARLRVGGPSAAAYAIPPFYGQAAQLQYGLQIFERAEGDRHEWR